MRMLALMALGLMGAAVAAAQTPFTVTTTAPGNAYVPGEAVTLRTTIARTGEEAVRAFGFRVVLPFGWTYDDDDTGVEVATQVTGLVVEHVWILPPTFPVVIHWTVSAPESAQGPAAFALQVGYRFDQGGDQRLNAAATLMQSTTPPGIAALRQRLLNNFATADADGDGVITPEEALAFDAAYDAEVFALLDVNGDGVIDQLELAINVLAGLDCGCAAEEAGKAKRRAGDLLLLGLLVASLAGMGMYGPRR